MSHDPKNILKLQISTYLEESLSMTGRMMLEDIFNNIDTMSESEATSMVEAHYDNNVFELIAPYIQKCSEEYDIYKRTPEGQAAFDEFKKERQEATKIVETMKRITYVKPDTDDNEGNGNVH